MVNKETSEDNWDDHYNTPEGKDKVDTRQAVYWCLSPDEQPPDYDTEIISALEYSGLSDEATIVDIGCSYPKFLELWKRINHSGQLIGVEPNSAQFNGLSYWQILDPDPNLEELKRLGDKKRISRYYALNQIAGNELDGIELYEARADFIPLGDGTADVATTLFSGYHAFENPKALNEIHRILKKSKRADNKKIQRAGIHADATSGNENKEEMIEQETSLAKLLSVILGQTILPPKPLQAGFTSEDTIETFPKIYKNVYVKHIRQEIIMNTGREFIINAHRTYRDSYVPVSGHLPEQFRDKNYNDRLVIVSEVFNHALESVVGGQIDDAIEDNRLLTAKVRRTITFASDDEIDLPKGDDGYEKIA